MISSMRHLQLLALTLISCALMATGCGDSTGGKLLPVEGGDGSAGQLTHIDGELQLDGETLTVTPAQGSDVVTLTIGPAVEAGALQALVASGAKARVYFAKSDKPIAAKIEAAPTLQAGTQTYVGKIVDVTANSITINGNKGARTFAIQPADAAAFDDEHLPEHQAEGSPVRIYFRPAGTGDNAISYEDA